MVLVKKWSYMTFEVIIHLMKYLRLHNVDILEKLLKDKALDKKYIAANDFFFLSKSDYKRICYKEKS